MSPETIKCRKCGVEIPCESHHLLPKGLYGDGETHYLCPNCHAAFHRYLGHKYLRKTNKQPMEFYFHKYYKWLYGIGIVAGVLFVLSYIM